MTRRLLVALVLLLAAAPSALRAYVFTNGLPAWPDGSITLELQLGSSPVYSDGTTPNATAIQAINDWNPSMARLQVNYVNNSSATRTRTNGKNNVFFDSKFFGNTFPEGVLAVTVIRAEGGKIEEADVVVNTAWQWDAYRGVLQYPKIDLRRVLSHEFGHVLTLGHPDQQGQFVTALMNAYISDLDSTQLDDKNGVSARYGHGPGNPAIPPTFDPNNPWDATVLAGSYVSFYAFVAGTQPIALQWLKDGVPITGATGNSFVIGAATLADAGKYALQATNTGGTVSSREATLTVLEPQPPTIIAHPQSKTVQHTGSFQISVSASSNAPMTFQWTKDEVAIPGATLSTYSDPDTQPGDAGVYRAIVSTAGGSATSNGAIITVVPAQPPTITAHPASATLDEGDSITLQAGFASEIPVTYQWMRNDVAIPGATQGGLTLSSVRMADAGSYRLVITNAGGAVSTNAATITVRPAQPPTIVVHPSSTMLQAGGSFSLWANASSSLPMTYQWTHDGVPIPGATGTTLQIYPATPSHTGIYRFIATNSAGSTMSQPAQVEVYPARPPEFVLHPTGGTVETGGDLSLHASVISTASVTYQWLHDDVEIPGQNNSSFYIFNATAEQGGTYRVRATNIAGSVLSNPAVVTVIPLQPPTFEVHPTSTTIEQGAQLALTCMARGTGAISYQWTLNGAPISGATNRHYVVDATTSAHAGDYAVRASNSAGTTTSNTATVTLIPTRLPEITVHPEPTTAEAHTSPLLSGNYRSAVPATVRWTKDGATVAGATGVTLQLNDVTEEAAGTYVMHVTNAAGTVSSSPALLSVVPTSAPKFYSHPNPGVYEVGTSRSLSVGVSSEVAYTIQWTKDGVPIPGATYQTLMLNKISASDAGVYRVVATNRAGSTLSNTATVKVIPLLPPVFVVQPSSVEAQAGARSYVGATVLSSATPTLQWFRNGIAVPGATSSYLYFDPTADVHAGTYTITATNAAGTTHSDPAIVTVVPPEPPTFSRHPRDVEVSSDSGIYLTAEAESRLPITYQWYRDGLPLAFGTSTYFSKPVVSEQDSGEYTLVATNAAGSTTSLPAKVTVLQPGPPRFTAEPMGRFVSIGEYLYLGTSASGPQPISYQWYKDGAPITGSNSPSLTISSFAQSDAGSYHVVATNSYGSTASSPAALSLLQQPLPEVVRLPNLDAAEGDTTSLGIWQPASVGPVTIQWYHNGTPIPDATGSTLLFRPLRPSDAGEYFATVTNATGTVTTKAGWVTVRTSTRPGAQWAGLARHGSALFLLNPQVTRIDRFDLATDSELPPILLVDTPTAIAATAAYLYVAVGSDILRMKHDGSEATPFASIDGIIAAMVATDTYLVLNLSGDPNAHRRHLASVRLLDGVVSGRSALLGSATAALAVDRTGGRVFSITSTLDGTGYQKGPVAFDLRVDGTFGPLGIFGRGELFPSGSHIHLLPDRTRVIESQGLVCDAATLEPVGTVGMPFDSVDFTSDGDMAVLRGSEVTIYDATCARSRRIALGSAAQFILVDGDDAVALSLASGGASVVRAQRIPLVAQAAENTPPPPPSPATVAYTPDAIATDRDGNILLLSRLHQALFRWDVRQQRYTASIRIDGHPNFLACIPATNTAYLAFADRSLVAIELDGSQIPYSVGSTPWDLATLTATGSHLAAPEYATGYGQSIALLGSEGEFVSLARLGGVALELQWSPANSCFYFVHAQASANPIQSVVLTPGLAWGTTSTVVDYMPVAGEWTRLLRVDPQGRIFAAHNGQIYDARGSITTRHIATPFADATWCGERMVIGTHGDTGSEIQRLDTAFGVDRRAELHGRLLRVLACGPTRIVAVTTNNGRPQFTLLDTELTVRNHFADTPDHTRVHLANLSTRGNVGTGDNIMIAGFVVTGSTAKNVLVRAIGPRLREFGVNGELADPVLQVVDRDGKPVAANDDWFTPAGATLAPIFRQVGAFGLDETSRDAALVVELPPGPYTALVRGKDDGTGIALVETYDLDADPGERRLINISTRGEVGIGDKVMIPGLVIGGTDPKRVLIRAVGPSMARFGLTGLADPRLRVVNVNSAVVAENDDWADDNVDVTIASSQAAGAFELQPSSRDAALVVTLAPGVYTVVVSGANDTTGLALVEVYEVP